jgi:hypothetical protein
MGLSWRAVHSTFLREPVDVLHMWIQVLVFALQLGRWIDAAVPGMPNRARLLRAAHSAGAKGSVVWLTQACQALAAPRGAWEPVFTPAAESYDCGHSMVDRSCITRDVTGAARCLHQAAA